MQTLPNTQIIHVNGRLLNQIDLDDCFVYLDNQVEQAIFLYKQLTRNIPDRVYVATEESKIYIPMKN